MKSSRRGVWAGRNPVQGLEGDNFGRLGQLQLSVAGRVTNEPVRSRDLSNHSVRGRKTKNCLKR